MDCLYTKALEKSRRPETFETLTSTRKFGKSAGQVGRESPPTTGSYKKTWGGEQGGKFPLNLTGSGRF